MNSCSSGHEEVCYNTRRCPLCKTLADAKRLEEENKDLRDYVVDLETELESYEESYVKREVVVDK